MNNLPQKIKLAIHGEEIDFSLTDKREIKYYGKTATSNESLWRTDKLEDNEVFYQTEWGWGVFVNIEERVLSEDERYDLCDAQKSKMTAISEEDYIKYNIPTKLITLTYNNETIESYGN
jgi:hypothetical protein